MITQKDREQLSLKNITEEQLNTQLESFKTGFPFLKLYATAAVGKGILSPGDEEKKMYLNAWENYKRTDKAILKFVPASGAASRMFKNMFEFLDGAAEEPETEFEKKFFDDITRFAFYPILNQTCERLYGKNISQLIESKEYKKVVAAMLKPEGLNYGNLPKGLLKFHTYKDGERTPVEEHLVEGALYAANKDGRVNLHFTVSAEHRDMFNRLVAEKVHKYAKAYGVTYDVTFSEQKPSTDTVAADMENRPFRDEKGRLVFRPGGHGALIENLNDLESDVIFVKNIDNVVPDKLKDDTVLYKSLIAGVLVELQSKAFEYMKLLDSGKYTEQQLDEMMNFVEKRLCCIVEKKPEGNEKVEFLKRKLNRPIRVCGMVKNVGEPGGGPFLAYNSDGTVSLQILESSQIDMNNEESRKMFENGTHFNPVDLVCGVRNYKGEKFDLTKYVDKMTGFISYKSKGGKELKALELPGLWNGAMSDWNTIFVEVPLTTFNPVKVVNDLLRAQHQ